MRGNQPSPWDREHTRQDHVERLHKQFQGCKMTKRSIMRPDLGLVLIMIAREPDSNMRRAVDITGGGVYWRAIYMSGQPREDLMGGADSVNGAVFSAGMMIAADQSKPDRLSRQSWAEKLKACKE